MAVVQVKQGATNTSPLVITLTSTGANTLIVLVSSSGTSTNPTTFTVTLGGAAGNFVQDLTFGSASSASFGAVWRDGPCVAGQTSLSIAFTGGVGTLVTTATVWECNDVATTPLDKSAKSPGSTTGTSWTSGATTTTAQALERAFGAVFGVNAPAGVIVTGPSSPWVNQVQLSQAQGAGFNAVWMAGANDLSSTAAVTYNGTFSGGDQYDAVVVTYKLTGGAAAGILPQQAKKRMPAVFTRINAPNHSAVYSR